MSENPILDKRILVTNDLSDETLVSCHSSAILQKTQLTCLDCCCCAWIGWSPWFFDKPSMQHWQNLQKCNFVNYIIEDPSWFWMSLVWYRIVQLTFCNCFSFEGLFLLFYFLEITISRDANLSSTCKFIFIILQIIRLRSISLSWNCFRFEPFLRTLLLTKKHSRQSSSRLFILDSTEKL